MNAELIRLAANCGIDARGMMLEQLRQAYKEQQDPRFADQHDVRLQKELERVRD